MPAGRRRGQQLERDRGEREDIRRRAPRAALDPLGRGVGTPDRRADADLFERLDDAEAGGARLVGRHEDVARVQAAVADAGGAREVDRAGELGDERQRLLDGRRRVVAHRDVQRLGRDVLFRPVRDRPLDAGGDGLDDGRMEQGGFGGAAQRVGEHLGLFGDDVEPEDLDGHQAIARRLIGAKNGTESANTNLVQHPEGAECWRRREMRLGPLWSATELLGRIVRM